MRLGQLARKLDRKPQELVDFLEKEHQITIEMDLNTKVDKDALSFITEAFKIEEILEIPVETKEEIAELTEKEIVEEVYDTEVAETVSEIDVEEEVALSDEEIEDIAIAAVAAEIEESEEPIEEKTTTVVQERIARVGEDGEELPELIVEDGVIKAPKPELDGFKVVGKIELPSTKRSIQFLVTNGGQTEDVTESIFETRRKEKEARKKQAFELRKARKGKQQKKRTSRTLTDADRKAHADRRAERKKAELEKKQAEKRKRHYEENVQKKAAVHSKKKKQKEIEKAAKKQKAPKVPEPTTMWGKFKKWLNT